jgi:hypothetical protein
MSSSSDNDEIVSVLALVATESAKREITSQNIGSSIGKAPKRERNFVQKMASIRDDDFVDNNEVRRNGGVVKRYSEEEFERRFRMPWSVFDEVFVVVSQDTYFCERKDAIGKPGAFPIQKGVSALRQLCYSLSSDGVEEYTGLSESTSNEALKISAMFWFTIWARNICDSRLLRTWSRLKACIVLKDSRDVLDA